MFSALHMYALSQVHLSVHHTGGSVKNGQDCEVSTQSSPITLVFADTFHLETLMGFPERGHQTKEG